MATMTDLYRHVANTIHSADGLIIAAGAGIGVDSGLPDFRGKAGFWRAYPGFRDAGLDFQSIANAAAFLEHPERSWQFYRHRLQLYQNTRPHAGFPVLRRWCDERPMGGFVYTSNIDSHFQATGFAASQIVECHGSLEWLQCCKPCHPEIWPADVQQLIRGSIPLCPRCHGTARPNIMLFNDFAFLHQRADEQHQAFDAWFASLDNPLVIEIGAGAAIPSVRRFAANLEATTVRINLHDASIAAPHISIADSALIAISHIDRQMQSTGHSHD